MSDEPVDAEHGPEPDTDWRRIMELGDSDEFFEATAAYWRGMLVRRACINWYLERYSRYSDDLDEGCRGDRGQAWSARKV